MKAMAKMMLGRVPRHLRTAQRASTGGSSFSRRTRGFTLVEVLVAAAILVVGLLGILTAFPAAYQDIMYGGRVTQAVALAQQKLEEVKAGGFPPTGGTQTSGTYTITWAVTSVGFGTVTGDLRKVTVTVTWSQRVRPGRYDLEGYIGKPY